MSALANLSLLKKISLPMMVIVALLIGLVLMAADSFTVLADKTRDVVDVSARRLALMLSLEAEVNELTIQEKNIISETDPTAVATYRARADTAIAESLDTAGQVVALADTPERRKAVEAVRTALTEYIAEVQHSIELAIGGKAAEARARSAKEGRTLRMAVADRVQKRVDVLRGELDTARDRAAALAERSLTILLAAAGTGLALALGIMAWIVIGLIVRPIAGVTGALERLASGDLQVTVAGTERGDEVGKLARALQVFRDRALEARRLAADQAADSAARVQRAERLDRLTRDFERSVGSLTAALTTAATDMETTAVGMSDIADETNRTASGVASAAQQTSANVQTVAAATEELSASVKEIAAQVAQSQGVTGQAVASARHADGRVRGLAAAADRIGAIVDLINTIAAQTNLLALNATIEAARAGEAGRGFAVVAAEVKQLADQTAKATSDIGAQIGSIRVATSDVVQAIQEFGTIIGQVSTTSTAIAAAMEEQDSATTEISRNVQQAARGTEEVTQHIVAVRNDAGRTGVAAGRVLDAARQLARNSDDLRRELDGFLSGVKAA